MRPCLRWVNTSRREGGLRIGSLTTNARSGGKKPLTTASEVGSLTAEDRLVEAALRGCIPHECEGHGGKDCGCELHFCALFR
jgi:hypothetical protein